MSQGLQGLQQGWRTWARMAGRQIRGTLLLCLASAIGGTVVGTANGWLLINCRFPGRWLRIAQLIPLATPPICSPPPWWIWAVAPDGAFMVWAGDRRDGPRHLPLVFLLSTESFGMSGRRQLEACRSMGIGPGPPSDASPCPLPCRPSVPVWP
ncbi:MAG: hypothetical protein CM15mP77_3710 [Synechococcus sp.]|nr:MAG: hypothetical protein CM15mP77_3710 [Synechococcus sp.]